MTPPPTMASAPTSNGPLTGSPRKTSAIATATSGAAPTVTEVRDAPVSWTARVNRICDAPGARRPARRKGQAPSSAGRKSAATSATTSAGRIVASAAAESPSRSASLIATVIAPKSAADATAQHGGHDEATRPANQSCKRRRGGGLRDHDPGHDHEATQVAHDAEPVAGDHEAEERSPHGLEGERERGTRCARPPLRPRLREEGECAREHARDEERSPHRRAVRDSDLPRCDRDDRQPGESREHLDERERDRVVDGREPLHEHDLERVDRRPREHEQVARRRATVDSARAP
jgi:hypothetical protein